jgi:hypothetical protein
VIVQTTTLLYNPSFAALRLNFAFYNNRENGGGGIDAKIVVLTTTASN